MVIVYKDDNEIEELVKAFSNRTLPQDKWTHDAHLTVAIYYLKKYNFYEALCLVKSNIIAYNLSIGGANTSTKGYHETLTVLWMKVTAFFINQHSEKSLENSCNAFLSSPLSARDLPFHFYNKRFLLSPQARAIYINGDKLGLSDINLQEICKQPIEISI